MAAASFVEGTAALAAALAAAAVLVLRDPRSRALAMPVALILALGAVALISGSSISDDVSGRVGLVGAAGVVGLVLLVVLTVAFVRRPGWFVIAVVLTLPFRIPVPTGADDTANLLLPLYGVLAAGVLAHLWRVFRTDEEWPREDPRARRVFVALAIVVVLYALQSLYSPDLEHAVKTLGFFYVPFAVAMVLLVELRWSRQLVLQVLAVTVGLALLFAAVGFVEWATGRLLISNEKVLAANDLKPYFRVNSLFFDPNVYGRFLAIVMVTLAGVLLWAPARRDVARVAVGLALLWAALVLTLSESSFAALLVGLAVLAALRWRSLPVLAVCGAGILIGVVLLVAAPGPARPAHQLVLRRGHGVERPREADPRRPGDGGRPPDRGLRLGLVLRAVPQARAPPLLVPHLGRVAHDPGHGGRGAGGDRPRRLRVAAVERVRARVRRAARDAAAPPGGRRAGGALRGGGGVLRAAAAHAGVRRLPRGPADLDAAGDGRGAAARGSRGRSPGFAIRSRRAGRSDLAGSYPVLLCVARPS